MDRRQFVVGSLASAVSSVSLAQGAAQISTLSDGFFTTPSTFLARESDQAKAFVDAVRRCDGLIIATPSYHGGISGLVKNAIDFIEDLRADTRVYLQDRAVGSIVCADGPQAMGATLASLRAIVHALRGWNTPYAAAINTRNRPFGADGQPADPTVIQACETVADEVVRFARMQAALR